MLLDIRLFSYLFIQLFAIVVAGQGKPDWIDTEFRQMKFPENIYFTGFAYGEVTSGRTLQEVTLQIKADAQAELSRTIRVQITSFTQSQIKAVNTGGQYHEHTSFENRSEIISNAELAGLNIESYYDPATKMVYAFAMVKRADLANYNKNIIAMNLKQAESLLQTAHNLEASGEKVQARRQNEAVAAMIEKVRSAQQLLMAIDPSIPLTELLFAKTEDLHDRLVQMQARLTQAVYVYMKSDESNFSKTTTVLGNRLKSALSAKGCSFTDDPTLADFRVFVNATTRQHGSEFGFFVCYADVAIQLLDVRKDKSVFQDEFSQKGISTSHEAAGRKALEDAAPIIVNKISEWIL